jgi:SAM-dependent methyltransferase
MNANNLGFKTGSFDFVTCGFMGWYDCFDFTQEEFTQQNMKAKEIWRVLREGGQVRLLFLGRARGFTLDGRGNASALPSDPRRQRIPGTAPNRDGL